MLFCNLQVHRFPACGGRTAVGDATSDLDGRQTWRGEEMGWVLSLVPVLCFKTNQPPHGWQHEQPLFSSLCSE